MKKIPAVSTMLLVSLVLLCHAETTKPQIPKERSYGSAKPLYFRAVFGNERKSSMLGVIDESKGTGTGYDTAYVDENMNGDLTDEQPKNFEENRKTKEYVVKFDFKGPLKEEQRGKVI